MKSTHAWDSIPPSRLSQLPKQIHTPHDTPFSLPPQEGKKLNEKVDLSSPKVVNTVELSPGEKKVFCRCWLSDTFPLCDGAHQKHNLETGDTVGPLIVKSPKPSQ